MSPLFRIGNQELVGVDLSATFLKLVHAKISANKTELLNILNRNISGLSEEETSKIIKGSFNELKAKNPDIINIISSHVIITKNIEVPSTNPQEIREIINLQASRYTPYSREEIVVDYIDIDTYKHSYAKILLVIVARGIVKKQIEIFDKAGIKLEKIVLASEGLAWFVPKTLKLETQTSPVNIVYIDEAFSEFSIVFRNKPVFIRSIPIGTQHLLKESENSQLKFVEELKKSFEAYQSEDIGKSPNALVLAGAVAELKKLEAVLNDNLHLPIKVISGFGNLIITDKASKALSQARHLSFLSVAASLLAREEARVDLIPEEIKLRKSLEKRGRELIKTGIFVLTIFILAFFILISRIYFKSAYLKSLNEKYQSLDQEAQNLEEDFVKVSLIRKYLSNRGYSLEALAELHELTPFSLELNNIRFDSQGKISIKGTAESMSTVFSFVNNMERSKYFKDVKTKYTTKRKDGMRDVTDFEINCLLKKETD